MAGLAEAVAVRRPGTLPNPRTPLVGRDDDLARLVAALGTARLITLTGAGGSGKTRLAVAAARAVDADAAWVDLAPVAEPRSVADTVRAVLGGTETAGPDATDAVIDAIRDADLLLCLDNCEHVVTAVADLVDQLLDACPNVRVLATSREPLSVDGESIWPVVPLGVPDRTTASADGVRATATGRLFELRAQTVAPTFRLTDADAAAAALLCRRTGGLPLAVELAAARVRLLSVEQIAASLDDIARTATPRPGTARQHSLHATLDWSHALLTEPERTVFRRLGVFPGSFDLPAAQAVVGQDVLDLLGQLVDRSLLAPQRMGGQMRYRLLAPIRAYARARLVAAGEYDLAADAHLGYYADLAELTEPLLSGPRQAVELDHLELEGNNLRAALVHAAARTPPSADGVRLVAALWRLCALRGHYAEGRRWLDWAATVDARVPPALRAKALLVSGSLAHLQCDYPAAVRRLEAALQHYRELDDHQGVTATLQVLGSVARERGRYARAEGLHRESLQLAVADGDELRAAQCHDYLGFVAWLQGHWPEARSECEQALGELRRLGDGEGLVWALLSLGTVALYQEEYGAAAELLGQARELSQQLGYREGLAWTAHQLGVLARRRDDPQSDALLLDALAGHRALGDRWRTAAVLEDLAGRALDRGEDRRAVALLAAAAGIRADLGTEIAPCERPDHDRIEAALRSRLAAEDFARAWAHGQAAPLDELVAVQPPAVSEPTSSGQLRIQALGASEVFRGERQLTPADWGYGKPRELLFLLVISPPRTKAEIGCALWPDLDGPQLRNAFHTALRDLRRALGDPGWVTFAAGRYTLDRTRDHWCDLEIFEEAVAAARQARPAAEALPHLRRAIDAYGGEFGVGLPDAEWVFSRREELARSYAGALAGAGRLLVAGGDLAEAVEVYRRAVDHDPLDEAAHRHLMTTLIRAGQGAQAAHVYRQLAIRLRDELGVAPAPETTAVYRQLGRSGTQHFPPHRGARSTT